MVLWRWQKGSLGGTTGTGMAKRQGAEGDRGCSCGTGLALWEKQLTVNMGMHMFKSGGSTSSQHPCGRIDKEGCATASEITSREAARTYRDSHVG